MWIHVTLPDGSERDVEMHSLAELQRYLEPLLREGASATLKSSGEDVRYILGPRAPRPTDEPAS